MKRDRLISDADAESRADRAAMLVVLPAVSACAPWLAFLQAHVGGTATLVGLLAAWIVASAPALGVWFAMRYGSTRCAPATWLPLVPALVVGLWFVASYSAISLAQFRNPSSPDFGAGIPSVFLDGVVFYGVVLGWFLPLIAALVGGLIALSRSAGR